MKRLSLTAWIFIGMAAGIALGAAAPSLAVKLSPLSNIFLRLIKSIIAPLIFGTLVYGIAGAGNLRAMGRIGLKAIVYFEIVTTIALFLGLAAVNLVRPGEGMKLERTASELALPEAQQSLAAMLEHVFPASIIEAMA
ncbi:MAG TPA: cation:dicarboxylase symporter family transporter, partial [Bryobacteraceae bacterium]|nr:cation:dicarboxylase symporter family transporter [Bryobacteraceae bacterium]